MRAHFAIFTLLMCSGLVFGAAFNESFTAGMPKGWQALDQPWQIMKDPDLSHADNQVLQVEALDGHVATMIISHDALGDGTLSFRSRFATPFPNVTSADKNDGKHFPHWRVNLMPQVDGAGLVLLDNHVWATLELSQTGQATVKQEGVRPQDTWIQWAITCKGGTCTVLQEGRQVLTSTYNRQACTGLSINVMHGRLYLDDISFKQ